jgi:PAS domain S-box-containing protein
MAKYPIVELENLRSRLREAEETLAAIRNGEVDSLIVSGPSGDQVFSLKGAEHPYRVFVEQMLEGAITLSTDGAILYCNRRFAQMVHLPLEKVIGSQFKSFVRAADQPELERILCDAPSSKVRYVLEAADGALVSAQLAFSRLPVDQVEAMCVVVTDLAEQQQKQELAAALQNLRAAQEQLQLQNDALVRARQQAEAASEAKDNFLAALSHELRTPLTPVMMAAASLETNPALPPSLRQDVAILRRNVELEARLIDDLLDLTRIARGKIELHSDIVDLHAVIGDALNICRGDISSKRLELVQALRAPEFHVRGDAVRLQQILWNLLRNAVKFTPEGGQIIIRSHIEEARVCVAVIDTGIGIEPGKIGRIFNPFEQGGPAITQQFGGLGLGLAISKKLAELHGGTVIAQSEGPSRGATFTLCLPHVPAPNLSHHDGHPAASTDRERRLRILLVEDHDDTRASLARLLGRRHTVRDVPSVEAALQTADRESFDLVISDIGLPDGSGLELMRALRDRYGLKGICLSGFGMEDDIARSAEAGFDHHLTKPIDLRKLEGIIHSLVH